MKQVRRYPLQKEKMFFLKFITTFRKFVVAFLALLLLVILVLHR